MAVLTPQAENRRPHAVLGRVMRMRKKNRGGGTGWTDYSKPVLVSPPSENLGQLYFMCYWYERAPRGGANCFTYSSKKMTQVSLL